MKIYKQKYIDYDSIGYGEANGWRGMYDWNKTKKIVNAGNIIILLVIVLVEISLITKFNINTFFLILSIVIYFILIIPIHEILHLIAFSPNIFSDKCHIYIGFSAVSAFYDGEISRNKNLFSLLLPFIAISIILGCLMIIANSLLPYLLLLLLLNAAGSWTDVYMFFYLLKKLPKNSIAYGNRYKI
ncbi:MAG: DUF3267 domain-containing protein [Oscillospiraceae bacterium]|nr:DUF3267 domain-containing protein [Oscillospiraceae bacterium]